MKVLQVLPALDAGGVERTTVEVADALVSAGHAAHVASEGGRLERELRALGATLHTLPLATKNPVRWRANSQKLLALIAEHGIDLVHARSRAPAHAARAAARAARGGAGIPFVTTYHGIYNEGLPGKRRYNSVMASGDLVIANSAFTREHIVRTHGTDPARIRLIPRAVDLARFDPSRVSEDLRGEWGVGPEATVWVLPGRLTEWKGQTVAIRALAHAPSARLVLVGDAQGRRDYVRSLRELAHRLGVASRLLLRPHSEDMPRVLASADIVISASTDPEAFGRVAVEAQAMGVPVVATAHGGALETVEDGVTGALVPPGDAEALARACAAVLARPFDARYARERVVRLYSDVALKKAVLGVYSELVAPNPSVGES